MRCGRSQSAEKLAVRAESCQSEGVGVGLAVDEQQVGLDVAFPIACPITRKVVIAVADIQGRIGRQRDQNRLELFIERGAVPTFGLPLVVMFEGG